MEMTQEQAKARIAELEKALAGKTKGKRLSEDELAAKYPHYKRGTLRWDELARKQKGIVICAKCGKEAERATSDFFQSRYCPECRKAVSKVTKAATRKTVTEQATELAALRATLAKAGISQVDVAAATVEAKEPVEVA